MIDTELQTQIDQIRATHEFLTFFLVEKTLEIKCGVVQNINKRFVTFYDMGKILSETKRQTFLSLSDRWWWESGRDIPVDYYIGKPFDQFQYALVILPRKTLSIDPLGPTFSITDKYMKRVKKRRIDLTVAG